MKPEQQRTLRRMHAEPTPTDISWSDVEAMLVAAGVEVRSRSSSRVALVKRGEVMIVYRPHAKPLSVRATVRDVAAFLDTVGVKP